MPDVTSQEGSEKKVVSGIEEELNKNIWKIIVFVVLVSITIIILLGAIRFFSVSTYGSP